MQTSSSRVIDMGAMGNAREAENLHIFLRFGFTLPGSIETASTAAITAAAASAAISSLISDLLAPDQDQQHSLPSAVIPTLCYVRHSTRATQTVSARLSYSLIPNTTGLRSHCHSTVGITVHCALLEST